MATNWFHGLLQNLVAALLVALVAGVWTVLSALPFALALVVFLVTFAGVATAIASVVYLAERLHRHRSPVKTEIEFYESRASLNLRRGGLEQEMEQLELISEGVEKR